MSRPPSLPPTPVAGLKALRAELGRLGYTEEGLRQRLGLVGLSPAAYVGALADPPLAPSLDGHSPLDWLIHLFLLRQPVARAELARLFSEEALGALEATQLVQTLGGELEATAAILPFEGLYLVADFAIGPRPADSVGFPDPATVAGARLLEPTFDDEKGTAVCLHAGNGLLPLLLKSKYGFGTVRVHDESPRPRQLTALAAALNDVQLDISTAPASSNPARSADVVAGSFPGIYRNSAVWGRRQATLDEDRWERAFSAAAQLIRDKGRAVLCHEIRSEPGDWFARKLQPVLGAGDLEMVWIRNTSVVGEGPVELGVSVMWRRPKDPTRAPLSHAGSLLGLPNATARGLQLYLESRRLLELRPTTEVLKLVPYRNARAMVDMRYEVGHDRTLVPGAVLIGPQSWPQVALEVLNLCNNVNTLQQVADAGENYAQVALELVVDGAVYLRKP
ncbi:MAG TPA: hypothetical protein VIG99_12425 [Myxococcaceae bacterium]|jgi:hypothetical protein